MLLDAEVWQGVFSRWTQSMDLAKHDIPTEVRAVDGKWSRASGLHIENGLHWTLDVAFREDESRARTQNAQANLVTLRHLALNQLKLESSLKASVKVERSRAGWNDDHLLKVLHA